NEVPPASAFSRGRNDPARHPGPLRLSCRPNRIKARSSGLIKRRAGAHGVAGEGLAAGRVSVETSGCYGIVAPAEAGAQEQRPRRLVAGQCAWIPAFAGMTRALLVGEEPYPFTAPTAMPLTIWRWKMT